VALGRHVRETEAWEVGSDHAISVGKARDQLAVLKRRGGKAVKKQNDRRIPQAGLAIKHR